jgi:hypothetical protein
VVNWHKLRDRLTRAVDDVDVDLVNQIFEFTARIPRLL